MSVGTEFSVDLINDLDVLDDHEFDWSGKPTSLFCIVTGNISDNYITIEKVLRHLGTQYRGVFFIEGSKEHGNLRKYNNNIDRLAIMCRSIPNVVYMHNHAVILNGVAFVGANCWGSKKSNPIDNLLIDAFRAGDITYLSSTIKNLQLYSEATKIVIFTSSPPSEFHEYKHEKSNNDYPLVSLTLDTEHKVSHWLFGGEQLMIDHEHDQRKFVNNPKIDSKLYWPKRVVITSDFQF